MVIAIGENATSSGDTVWMVTALQALVDSDQVQSGTCQSLPNSHLSFLRWKLSLCESLSPVLKSAKVQPFIGKMQHIGDV
jgi:hypothetical protein